MNKIYVLAIVYNDGYRNEILEIKGYTTTKEKADEWEHSLNHKSNNNSSQNLYPTVIETEEFFHSMKFF